MKASDERHRMWSALCINATVLLPRKIWNDIGRLLRICSAGPLSFAVMPIHIYDPLFKLIANRRLWSLISEYVRVRNFGRLSTEVSLISRTQR
jgi:hypothetical protein